MLLVDDFYDLTGGWVDEDKLVIDVEVFQCPGRWNLDVDALWQRGEHNCRRNGGSYTDLHVGQWCHPLFTRDRAIDYGALLR